MENDFSSKIKDFFLKGENSLSSNIVKSLLIGLTTGLLIGLTGEKWDFKISCQIYSGFLSYTYEPFCYYGTTQAIIGGIIVSLICFLRYNKNEK